MKTDQRDPQVHLTLKSKERAGKNRSPRERREIEDLLDKLGHIELAGSVARTLLPFRPLSSSAQWALEHRHRRHRKALDAETE